MAFRCSSTSAPKTDEATTAAYDKLRIRVRAENGTLLATTKTFSNLDAGQQFRLHTVDLTTFAGKSIQISFEAQEDARAATSFVIDDVKVVVKN